MRVLGIGLCVLLLGGCVESRQATLDDTKKHIFVTNEGCPLDPGAINIGKNGKITWVLDNKSPGYDAAESFAISFEDNPTLCDDTVTKKANQQIKCTVSGGADGDAFYCYSITVTPEVGIGCTLDPTIYVNELNFRDEPSRLCSKMVE